VLLNANEQEASLKPYWHHPHVSINRMLLAELNIRALNYGRAV